MQQWDATATALKPLIVELYESAQAAGAWLVVNIAEAPAATVGSSPYRAVLGRDLANFRGADLIADDEKDAFDVSALSHMSKRFTLNLVYNLCAQHAVHKSVFRCPINWHAGRSLPCSGWWCGWRSCRRA